MVPAALLRAASLLLCLSLSVAWAAPVVKIVTSTTDLQALTEAVGGNLVEIACLVLPGEDAEEYRSLSEQIHREQRPHGVLQKELVDHLVPIGKAKVVRPGNNVTIVAWSLGMSYALKAADELAKKHILAEVIDLTAPAIRTTGSIPSTPKPLPATSSKDWNASTRRTRRPIAPTATHFLRACVERSANGDSGSSAPMPQG